MKTMNSKSKSGKIHAKPQRQRQEIPSKKTIIKEKQSQESIPEAKTGPLEE